MLKYGVEFAPAQHRPDWFAAVGIENDHALEAANRIHRQSHIGTDLVFCGTHSSDSRSRLYLIECGNPVEIAREFEVGAEAESYDRGVVDETQQMLRAVFAVAPFTPVLVNAAAFEARFINSLDKRAAERVLRAMEENGSQGMEYYASSLPDLRDEDIISMLVEKQRLNLWWD